MLLANFLSVERVSVQLHEPGCDAPTGKGLYYLKVVVSGIVLEDDGSYNVQRWILYNVHSDN